MKLISKLIVVGLLICSADASFGASEAVKGAQKDYASFKTEMTAKLNQVEAKLEQLRVEAKQKGNAVEDKTVMDLEKSRVQMQEQLDHAQKTSSKNWDDFRQSFADSLDLLNSKIQTAVRPEAKH